MSESSGVIHDIGYRGYDGPREGTWALVATLYLTSLKHAYGLGRSGRSKVLPGLLLAINLLPAVVIVGVLSLMGLNELPLAYPAYTSQLQMVISLFAAAQAPVLFSRDLRHRSIVLYLARPLPAVLFALTRWAALATAIFIFTLLPSLVLYIGGLLAGLEAGSETPDFAKSVALQVLLAALLAGITGFISSVALRRGFAVVASIVVMIVLVGIVLIFPWALHNGLAHAWGVGNSLAELSTAWTLTYLAAAVLFIAGCLFLLVRRFLKVSAR